ncbi:MAG TPA: nucleotidyltransferase family protein [Prolixibacteraceae bacterium]|nr:nucleotidyltransferase family protein [Prolixibacteraceae bacterium]
MRAMIFAAGLGTRLYPLTIDKPKALVEVADKTLLQMAIEKVSLAGYHDLVINIHHFGDQIIRFLAKNDNFGQNITISDECGQLLNTGGGILKAAPLLDGDEAFLVYNVDVLSNIDLQLFRKYHLEQGGLVTLAVRDRNTARYLAFDEAMQLTGWRNIKTGDEIASRNMHNCSLLAFSGIQLIEPAIFKLITETGSFPLIPLYLRLAAEHRIMGYQDQSTLWMDLGKPEQIKEAEKMIVKQ